MYRLKKGQEAFQVVDGPFAKRRYRHGVEYADGDIPPQEKKKFEPACAKASARQEAPGKVGGKNQKASNLKPLTSNMTGGNKP